MDNHESDSDGLAFKYINMITPMTRIPYNHGLALRLLAPVATTVKGMAENCITFITKVLWILKRF